MFSFNLIEHIIPLNETRQLLILLGELERIMEYEKKGKGSSLRGKGSDEGDYRSGKAGKGKNHSEEQFPSITVFQFICLNPCRWNGELHSISHNSR